MLFCELALFAWVPTVLLMFAALPPRRAVITAFIGGWLFLPVFGIDIVGLPPFSKVSASAYSVLLGVAIFDSGRLMSFRPRWFDLPIIVWCFTPLASSISNHIGDYGGVYDGLSACLSEIVLWGIPYYLGRVYFSDWDGIRELAIGVFIGGLIYMPFTWAEMRLSPQFHKWVYGFHQHSFAMTIRSGGWRPMVFMQHGIACAMWMTASAIVGVWLWTSGTLKHVLSIPTYVLAPLLVLTAAFCHSAGALVLLVAGLGTYWWVRTFQNALPLLALILFIPAYVTLRASQAWTGENLVEFAQSTFGEQRAESLEFRLQAENLLTQKALQQPWFGWGRWNRNRVYDPDTSKDLAVTDGLWVIVLGTTGWVGLTAIMLVILLPAVLYLSRCPPRWWMHPMAAPGAAFALLLPLHMIDNLWNAMLNPIYVLLIGAMMGLGAKVRTAQARQSGFPIVPRPMAPPLAV